jgi:hypothetical protein
VLGNIPDFRLTNRDAEAYGTEQLEGTIRQLSLSVDPALDSAEVLRTYGVEAGADFAYWNFLTGDHDTLFELCKTGFDLPVFDANELNNGVIAHSQTAVLVDRQGRIRGYYDALDDAAFRTLKSDIDGRIYEPCEVRDVPWMEARAAAQLATVEQFETFHGFRFEDQIERSGISFRNRIVEDAGRAYKAVHYDHGNGVIIADIDGDGRADLYFLSQLRGNELWRNRAAGRFDDITEHAGLDGASLVDKVGISWPSGSQQTIPGPLDVNQLLTVREPSGS